MKIQYLGTAAAEGVPALFCDCDVCKKSRERGGRNIRTRSQALIDDKILIDFPADTYMHFLLHNVPLAEIKSCLITHSHSDHLYVNDIVMRKNGAFANLREGYSPLTFYSDFASYEKIVETKRNNRLSDADVLAELLPLNTPVNIEGYSVTALRAAHDPLTTPVVYIIEKDGKSIFYANDSSEYPEQSMNYLRNLKKPLDVISLDCTSCCNVTTYMGHLDIYRCDALRKELIAMGAADENTKWILHHFSHNGKNALYDDFVKIAADMNFDISYDGKVLEF